MGDGWFRSFDDVYLVYPLLNKYSGEKTGAYISLRKVDYRTPLFTNDPEYPHMVVKYYFSPHHRKRMGYWQVNQLNYYKQERRWIVASVSDQCNKENM